MNEPWERALVSQHFSRGVGVWLLERRLYNGSPTTAVAQSADLTFVNHDEATMLPTSPSLLLSDGHARALLDALSAHYGGSSDVQTLRKDYMAERARVDRFIEHMVRTP